MKENFDYDYTIAVHFQSLDEMRPELAFRIGAWIGSSKYIDWEISTVGDCFCITIKVLMNMYLGLLERIVMSIILIMILKEKL